MSEKYVIELDDRIKLVTSVGVTENGVVYTTSDYVHNLEELNSDYINEHYGELQDDAYKHGLEDGRKVGIKDGMCEAWEVARRIVVDTDHGGLALGTLSEIFGTQSYSYIMRENTAQEAIDKIKAYEDEHSDRIEVGDEVVWNDGTTLTVTRVHKLDDDEWCDGMDEDGRMYGVLKNNVRKTGRHYDVKSILEAMQDVTER